MLARRRAVLSVFAVLCEVPCAQPAAVVGDAAPVRIVCNFDDPEVATAARAMVDAVWRQMVADCGPLPWSKPPAEMRVLGDVDTVTAARHAARLSGDVPGYVTPAGQQAFVFLMRAGWSRDEERRFAEVTAELAARVRYPERRFGLLRRALPRVASTQWALRNGRILNLGTMGYLGASLDAAKVALTTGELPPFADLLREMSVAAPRTNGQLVTWSELALAFGFAQHAAATRAALRALRADGPGLDELLVRAIAALTGEAAADLDAEFVAWLRSCTSTADKEILVPDGRGRPGDADYVPHSPGVHWLQHWGKESLAMRGEVTLRQGELQGDVVFERAQGRWLRVTFVAGGYVVVSERRPVKDGPVRRVFATADPNSRVPPDLPPDWHVLARAHDVPGLVEGQPIGVRVAVRNRQVVVSVLLKDVLTTPLPAGGPVQRIGVGGPHFNQVRWSGVRVQ